MRLYSSERQSDMMVYSLRHHTAIDCVSGNEHVLFADSTLMDDESTVDYSLKGCWAQCGLSSHPDCIGLDEEFANTYVKKRDNIISFGGKLLVLWNEEKLSDSLSCRFPADFVLVTGKQKPDLVSLLRGYNVGKLLIDGSVPNYLAIKWEMQAEEIGLSFYNLADGAFEVK